MDLCGDAARTSVGPMICPHCNRTIREERRYLMSVRPERPGLIGSLRGEGGEGWRIFVTVGVCVLAVLLITGLSLVAGVSGA
jgi:hypothetical protein